MRTDLLLKIADELDAFVPTDNPISFDMGTWLEEKTDGCGTVCCAIGLGVLKIPEVRGLFIENDHRHFEPMVDQDIQLDNGKTLTNRGYGYYAVALAFGLSSSDASYLFSSMSYSNNDPKVVAARIRQFVKERGTNEQISL